MMNTPATKSQPRIAIIGAGLTGILAAIKLKESGNTNFVIYEKAEKLGGTWHHNTYPGLTCDVPSHFYRYAEEPNPDWSFYQSSGSEIWAYLNRVANKHDIVSFIRYREEVTRLTYHDYRWTLETASGIKEDFDFIFAATGFLHFPALPDIKGLRDFAGPSFHSAQWDHSVALEGKRVGIIGSGSTAVQIVCGTVDRVKELRMFQRTPQWIWPVPNAPYSEEDRAGFRRSPESVEALYVKFKDWFTKTFGQAVIGDQEQIGYIERACLKYLNTIEDPVLRAKLTPDYKVLCKRLVMSSTFYRDIQKPNAHLITDGIERIEPAGVRTVDGTLHELDVLVLATGFDAHAYTGPMQILGENGVSLKEAWSQGATAYRSMTIPGFPNFLLISGGPNSPVGNFSAYLVSETQIAYALQLVDLVRTGACRGVAPKSQALERFLDAIKKDMKDTVWASGCKSWYLDKHGNPVMWPWSFERFVQEMQHPDLNDYELIS